MGIFRYCAWVQCVLLGLMYGHAPSALGETPSPQPASRPSNRQNVSKESPFIRDGKAAMAEGRYKEARDLFLQAVAADPKNYRALNGAGSACLFLRDNTQANKLLEQAADAAPVADRTVSYNFAVSDMNLFNYRRASQTLRDYLYTNTKNLDEPLLDALGICLFQTGEKNTASRVSDDTRKFFSVYTALLEEKRPGMKKWGTKWLPAADVESRAQKMRDGEIQMGLVLKQIQESNDRVAQYRRELQAARKGNGVRSAKDASKFLNDEEIKLKANKEKYDKIVANIDTIRPEYPQLLLPIDMDQTSPPPFEAMAAPAPTPAPQSSDAVKQPAPIPNATAAPPTDRTDAASSGEKPTITSVLKKPPTKDVPSVEGIGEDQLRQCNVDADGTISVDHEVKLSFRGTEGRDFTVAGEMFLGGGGNASGERGGLVFYLRETDGMHRYELTGYGMRVKRVLLAGQVVPKFANPFTLNTPAGQWVPFRIEAKADGITVTFDSETGTAQGPVSTNGSSSVVITPGSKLRNLKIEIQPK